MAYTDGSTSLYILHSNHCSVILQLCFPEALLSGVAIMLPDDPWEFMEKSVMSVKNGEVSEIQWYVCVGRSRSFHKGYHY